MASPSERLHQRFLVAIGYTPEEDDPSNQLLDIETQLGWLCRLRFIDVDCHWKWSEMGLLARIKP